MDLQKRKDQITALLVPLREEVCDLEAHLTQLKALLEAEGEDEEHKGIIYRHYEAERDRLDWWWPRKLSDALYTKEDYLEMSRAGVRRMATYHGMTYRESCNLSTESMVEWLLSEGITYEVLPPRPKWAFDTEASEELMRRFTDLPEWSYENPSGTATNFKAIREEGIEIIRRLDELAKPFGLDASIYLYPSFPDIADYKYPEQIIDSWWGRG